MPLESNAIMSSCCTVPLYIINSSVDTNDVVFTDTSPVTVSECCILNITLNILTDFSLVQNLSIVCMLCGVVSLNAVPLNCELSVGFSEPTKLPKFPFLRMIVK